MADLYNMSGMSSAPMFVHWTPVQLDLSPYREDRMMMMQMAGQAVARQPKAADVMPKDHRFEGGLPTSLAILEGMHNDSRSEMISAINAHSDIASATSSPEFMGAYARSRGVTAGSVQAKYVAEKEAVEALQAAAKGREHVILSTTDGNLALDPLGKDRFMDVGRFLRGKWTDPRFSDFHEEPVIGPMQSYMFIDPDATMNSIFDNFKKTAVNDFASADVDENFVGSMMENGRPDQSMLAAVMTRMTSKSNEPGIHAAYRQYFESLPTEARSAILQRFYKASQDRVMKKKSEGGFRNEDGTLDERAFTEAAFTEKSFPSPLRPDEQIPFANFQLESEAKKALVDSGSALPVLRKMASGKARSGGVDADGNVNIFAYTIDKGPTGMTNRRTGEQEYGGTPFDVPVPMDKNKKETSIVMSQAFAEHVVGGPGMARIINTKLAGNISEVEPTDTSDQLRMENIFADSEMILPNGAKISTRKGDMYFRRFTGSIVHLPHSYDNTDLFEKDEEGNIRADSEGRIRYIGAQADGIAKELGANTFRPYMEIEVYVPSTNANEEISDYYIDVDEDGKRSARKIPINTGDYISQIEKLGKGRNMDGFFDKYLNIWTVGTRALNMPVVDHTMKVLVPVPPHYAASNDPDFKVNLNSLSLVYDTRIGQAVNAENQSEISRSAIQGAMMEAP